MSLLEKQVYTSVDISTTSDVRTTLKLLGHIASASWISLWNQNIPTNSDTTVMGREGRTNMTYINRPSQCIVIDIFLKVKHI